MEITASSIAAEFKRQVDSQLPAEPISTGGFHHITIKVSAPPGVSIGTYFDAIGILLQQLADERPEWKIGLEGDPSDLVIEFIRWRRGTEKPRPVSRGFCIYALPYCLSSQAFRSSRLWGALPGACSSLCATRLRFSSFCL